MSVDCTGYVGFTVTLKENLSHDDFNFFGEFSENHSEYNKYDCKGSAHLVVDGMNGFFARLIFVDEVIRDCMVDGKDYFCLKSPNIPDHVYSELNKAYQLMYGHPLDVKNIEYALWFISS